MRSADRRALIAGALLALAAPANADCAELAWAADGTLPAPLAGAVGEPERGAAVALDRDRGDCTICHRLPLPGRRFHGTVGPALDDVGRRLTDAQLRARIAAPRRQVPATVMPEYCTTGDRYRVDPARAGKPILTAGEIEDLVAWLSTLRGEDGP